jgi:hypothetical protein
LTFQTRDFTASGELSHQTTCPILNGFWSEGFLGVEHKPFWLKISVTREASRASLELYPGIYLTTEEKHGNPQSGYSSSHRTTHCADLAVF